MFVGIITNWLVEFLILDTLFGYSWRTIAPGSSDVTWMLPSLLRALLISLTTISVYLYISPERFGEEDQLQKAMIQNEQTTVSHEE